MIYLLLLAYLALLAYTIVRILLETDSTPKTLAYLLLVVALPVAGIFIYFAFGINYRHQKSTASGIQSQHENVIRELKPGVTRM